MSRLLYAVLVIGIGLATAACWGGGSKPPASPSPVASRPPAPTVSPSQAVPTRAPQTPQASTSTADCSTYRTRALTSPLSQSEKQWFEVNCGDDPSADRSDCAEIQGTPYRSNSERAWFLANCTSGGAPAVAATSPPGSTTAATLPPGPLTTATSPTQPPGTAASPAEQTYQTIISAPPGLYFTFGSGVADEALIRGAIESARDYARLKLGITAETIAIFVYSGAEAISDAKSRFYGAPRDMGWFQGRVAEGGYRNIFLNTGPPSDWSSFPSTKGKIVAHEYFHTVQWELMGGSWAANTPYSEPRAYGPTWLIEGTAELLAWLSEANRTGTSFAEIRANQVSSVGNQPASLASMAVGTKFAAIQAAYSVAFLAADLLTEDAGLASIASYYAAIGARVPWADAFQQSFGISVDDFYAAFDQHRASGYN